MAAAGRRWKCGVCSAKAGDLVCGGCVTREAERRRTERAERLGALRNVRVAAAFAIQARGGAVEQDARLQKEAADESRLKDQVREVTKRVAEERIKVASAAFALKHHRDLLAAAESHLSREQTSAVEMKEALLEGLRQHAEDAARTLRQRRWRKVVQLFVLLPVEPSIPPRGEGQPERNGSRATSRRRSRSPGAATKSTTAAATAVASGGGEALGGDASLGKRRGTGLPPGAGGGAAPPAGGEVVSGVSTLVDLPLPNNGDYGQVPPDVLMASLALLARLVAGLASCLGVSLPHPLFPAASTRYATISVDSSPRERSSQYPLCPLSKLAEIGVMGSASSVCNTVGAFDTALDLLRSDVVHLCVEGASVPVDSLWPAEALLLNLWELHQHAVSELRRLTSPMIDVPVPMPRDPLELGGGSRRHGGGREGGGASPRTAPSVSGNRLRRTSRGMRSRLGFGGGVVTLPSPPPPPPPPPQGVAGREEDDEATYEFIAGGGVLEEENAGGTGGGEGSGAGWPLWGSRLAAAGSGGGGLS
eukprot:g2792.t1